jgi:hypothetical protein
MRVISLPAAILLIALAPYVCEAKHIKGSGIAIGAWSVDAYANDDTGAFSHCTASVPYKSGILLVFSIQSGAASWQMGLANPEWKLPTGKTYPIAYKIDRTSPQQEMATVLTPTLIAFDLPANSDLFGRFRAGHLLVVGAAGGNFRFSLKDSSRALSTALACAKHYENYFPRSAHENPFVDSVGSIPAGSSELKTEATTVLANVLGSAGIQGFRLVSDVPDALKDYGYHVLWGAPGMVGGLKVFRSLTVPDAVTLVIAQQERECTGAFGSYRERSEIGLVSIRTACKETIGGNTVVTFNFVPRPSGGSYQFFTTALSASEETTTSEIDAATATAGKLFDASLRTVETR